MATTPPPTTPGTYHVVGGTLVIPPQPDVMSYALRQDQFETLCDGQISVSRSVRDACVGAFATGMAGLIAIWLTLDWDLAEKQGRHPMPWVILLCTLTAVALLYGIVESIRMWRTQSNSPYARVVRTIKQYFGIS